MGGIYKFSITLSSDGRQSQFGNEYDLNIDEAVEELIYYDFFSEKYTLEELKKYLEEMKVGYITRGDRWFEFKIYFSEEDLQDIW